MVTITPWWGEEGYFRTREAKASAASTRRSPRAWCKRETRQLGHIADAIDIPYSIGMAYAMPMGKGMPIPGPIHGATSAGAQYFVLSLCHRKKSYSRTQLPRAPHTPVVTVFRMALLYSVRSATVETVGLERGARRVSARSGRCASARAAAHTVISPRSILQMWESSSLVSSPHVYAPRRTTSARPPPHEGHPACPPAGRRARAA
jgi:hypothetical protein